MLNFTANASNGHAIPIQLPKRSTHDISVLLQFDWYELVYNCQEEINSSSVLTELVKLFDGISEHAGYALTYKVLLEDS